MSESIIGKINSIQTLGTLDGPGVRFIAFLQGCNLKCGCCHNPEMQSTFGGTKISAEELVKKVLRCKEYFGREGGITLSGGEVLLQADFAKRVFELCHENAAVKLPPELTLIREVTGEAAYKNKNLAAR